MLWDSDDFNEQRQALRSKISQMLGEEATSPLNGRIVIGENESSPQKCITVEALQNAIKKTRFFSTFGKKNVLIKEGTFDSGDLQETSDKFYPFIEDCIYSWKKRFSWWIVLLCLPIVIGAAAIVPHNAIADSLMDEISTFVEENTEAEILDELREIR